MNRKPDPRVRFEPELALQPVISEPTQPTWLPIRAPHEAALDRAYWLTRASRGFSWNRAGRVKTRVTLQ